MTIPPFNNGPARRRIVAPAAPSAPPALVTPASSSPAPVEPPLITLPEDIRSGARHGSARCLAHMTKRNGGVFPSADSIRAAVRQMRQSCDALEWILENGLPDDMVPLITQAGVEGRALALQRDLRARAAAAPQGEDVSFDVPEEEEPVSSVPAPASDTPKKRGRKKRLVAPPTDVVCDVVVCDVCGTYGHAPERCPEMA